MPKAKLTPTILVIAVCLFLAFVLVPEAQANLIDNGSFDGTGTIPPDPADPGNYKTLVATNNDIPGWRVTTNQIKWVRDWWTAQEGELSIDLSGGKDPDLGNPPYPGTLEATSWNPTSGETYTVTFYMTGNFIGTGDTIKSLEVRAGGQSTSFTFTKPSDWTSNVGWEKKTWTFTASNTDPLRFVSLEDSSRGPVIDNVSVGLVPLPPSLLLLGTGLMGLGALGWRWRKLPGSR
jgi:choice-of-anchor C domain-containing protein